MGKNKKRYLLRKKRQDIRKHCEAMNLLSRQDEQEIEAMVESSKRVLINPKLKS